MKNQVRKAISKFDFYDEFCQYIKNALDRKVVNRVNITEKLMRKNILSEAFPPQQGNGPAGNQMGNIASAGIDPNVTPKDAELVLDPEFEKEYYIDDDEIGDHYIIYKKIGLGMAKPIRVYIDGKPWEIFTTLKFAKKITNQYITTGRIDKDQKQAEQEEEEQTKNTHDKMLKTADVQAKIAKKFEPKDDINKDNTDKKKESDKK